MHIHADTPARHSRPVQLIAVALLALTTLLAGACNSRHTPETALLRMGDGLTDAFKGNRHAKTETTRIEAKVPLSVDVETFNGDVTIRANPTARQATVVVRRESVHGHKRSGEGKESLEEVDATVEVVAGDLGPALRVRASTGAFESHFQRAHIWIEVPEIDDVKVRTGLGRVDVRRAYGRVDIEARRGDVLYATPASITQTVMMVTSDGDVDFRAGRGTTGDLDMKSIGGRVLQRVNAGRLVVTDTANRRDHLIARLGSGGNSIVLRAIEGNVRIAVVDDPMAFGLKIVDP